MEIRKKFKIETAHIVRNCSTEKCKKSIHGHSAIIEVFLTSNKLDNGGMIMDFSLLKRGIGAFIDLFDHSIVLWSKDNDQYRQDMKRWSDRWIELSLSPSAENLALFFCAMANRILRATTFTNGEGFIVCNKVIYHETETGCAIATEKDCDSMLNSFDMTFSKSLMESTTDELHSFLQSIPNEESDTFINPIIKLQV